MEVTGPPFLQIPQKLLPVLTDLNKYKFVVIEGGRGSAKTQTIARILMYLSEKRKLRIICGREIMETIEESVYTVLTDLIEKYNLAFTSTQKAITSFKSGSKIIFKGFREQGKVNIKGVEGADICWVDEAQSITKGVLNTLIPTIRKSNCIIIFTMNRDRMDDAVIEELVGRDDVLHIKIDYFENEFCPLTLKHEAEVMKNKDEREYNRIWLGHPTSAGGEFLFDYAKLQECYDVTPFGDLIVQQRVLAIDFAAQGDDNCVATVLDRVSDVHWSVVARIPWPDKDPMSSIGKITELIGQYNPDMTVIDGGGSGYLAYARLVELGVSNIFPFDGGSTDMVDTKRFANQRAEGYCTFKEWVDKGWLMIRKEDREIIKQAEKIKFKYRSTGQRLIQDKREMKKAPPIGIGYSPDDADSVMMGIFGIIKWLGTLAAAMKTSAASQVQRKTGSKRR